MFLDLADKIISRCLQLIGYVRTRREDEFKRLIEEPYHTFCELHEEYLKSFMIYRERLVEAKDMDISSILDEISRDAIFNLHKRSKLRAALENCPRDDFSKLMKSIKVYLDWDGPGMRTTKRLPYDVTDDVQRTVSANLRSMLKNIPRGVAFRMLAEIQKSKFDIDRRRQASVILIDEIVATIQELQSRVTKEYYVLRKEFSR